MPRSTESRAPIVPIIGGGPAGMSCALWLHNYGLNPVIIEKEGALGGMARLSPYPNAWLLGQRGKSGRENAAEFADHMRELAVETWLRARPHRLRRGHDERVRLDGSGTPGARAILGPALLIAARTGIPGEGRAWRPREDAGGGGAGGAPPPPRPRGRRAGRGFGLACRRDRRRRQRLRRFAHAGREGRARDRRHAREVAAGAAAAGRAPAPASGRGNGDGDGGAHGRGAGRLRFRSP